MTPPPESTHDPAHVVHSAASTRPGRRSTVLVVVLVLVGVANHVRALGWGFLCDDWVHQFVLRRPDKSHNIRPWDLYNFGGRPKPGDPEYQRGGFPWWTPADLKLRFFRPVTSLSILLDFTLYGRWAPGYHLTSLALYAVFLILAFKLYVGLGAPRRAALWALALLALDNGHVLPVAWIANRNSLLAALFTVATLLAFHRYRRGGSVAALLVAMLCCLLACGSKESGVIATAIVGLYLLLIDRPSRGESLLDGCRRVCRPGPLWVFVLLTGAYVAYYVASGYGTRSAMYCTPWSDPIRFITQVAALIPLASMSLFLNVSIDIIFLKPHLVWPAAGASVPILAVVGVVVWRILRSTPRPADPAQSSVEPTRRGGGAARLAGFALGWALLSVLPVAGVFPSDRLLMNASVGTALLVGLLLDYLGPLRGLWAAQQYRRFMLGGFFIATNLVLSVPLTLMQGKIFRKVAVTDRDAAASADIDRTRPSPRAVFALNSPSAGFAGTLVVTWPVLHDDYETGVFFMQFGRRDVEWCREGANTMVLTFGSPPLLDHPYERFFLTGPTPPPVGTIFTTANFRATVQDVAPTGIRAVRFEFNKRLDDPSYQFLAWSQGHMGRIDPPPIGGRVTLPRAEPLLSYAP